MLSEEVQVKHRVDFNPFWPIGSVRLVQYRVTPRRECLGGGPVRHSKPCNQLYRAAALSSDPTEATEYAGGEETCSDAEDGSEECKKTPSKAEAAVCADPTETGEATCREHRHDNTGLGQRPGVFAAYSPQGFSTDFNSTRAISEAKIKHLKEANWIDGFTRAVALKWTIFNAWDENFYSVILLCESPSRQIRSCSFEAQSVSFPEKQFYAEITEKLGVEMDTSSSNPVKLQIAIGIGYILLNLIYSVRIALELSLGMCIVTNTLESIHIVASVTAVVLFLIR